MRILILAVILTICALLAGQEILFPLKGDSWVSSGFGDRQNPMGGGGEGFHSGLDLAARKGTIVIAVADGWIASCYPPPNGWFKGDKVFGGMIVLKTFIRGLPMYFRYGHLSVTSVKEGQYVSAGQIIGKVGSTGSSTGSHLHFEVMVDPRELLDDQRGQAHKRQQERMK